MFVDNLRLHRMKVIVAHATSHSFKMHYNAAYSPIFNPIEGLWAYTKRNLVVIVSKKALMIEISYINWSVKALQVCQLLTLKRGSSGALP